MNNPPTAKTDFGADAEGGNDSGSHALSGTAADDEQNVRAGSDVQEKPSSK